MSVRVLCVCTSVQKEVRDLFGPLGTIKDIRLRDGFCFLEVRWCAYCVCCVGR